MAYEYTLALPAEPPAPDFAALLTCFAQRVGLCLYVVERSAWECRYAFDSTLRSKWPEDFAVSADTSAWYVAFYSVTGAQQARVLTALTGCLHEAGVSASFEEL